LLFSQKKEKKKKRVGWEKTSMFMKEREEQDHHQRWGKEVLSECQKTRMYKGDNSKRGEASRTGKKAESGNLKSEKDRVRDCHEDEE